MPSGLEITNTYNTVLIDSEHPCLVFSRTYTQADLVASTLGGVLTLTDATDDTVIAYQGAIYTTLSHVRRVTSTTREFWWPHLSRNTACKFYRFERIKNLNTRYGLVLYDSNGNVTFDAAQKPARVVGTGSMAVPAGRSYAIVFAQNRYQITYFQFDPEDGQGLLRNTNYYQTQGRIQLSQVSLLSQRNISSNQTRVPYGTPQPIDVDRGSAFSMVLDVTGY